MKRVKVNLLKLGFVVLLISTSLFLIFYFYNQGGFVPSTPTKNASASPTPLSQASTKIYTSEDYGFSVEYPRLLFVKETKNTGNYLLFVSFEQNQYSLSHGFAIGVSSKTLENQVLEIKKEFEEETSIDVSSEESLEFAGYSAVGFGVTPKDSTNFESRRVVVIRKGDYTYSLSSRPEDLDVILSTFKFLTEKGENGFCGDNQTVCPDGFFCQNKSCVKS